MDYLIPGEARETHTVRNTGKVNLCNIGPLLAVLLETFPDVFESQML